MARLGAAVVAVNSLARDHGHSPYQIAIGNNPEAPTELHQESPRLVASGMILPLRLTARCTCNLTLPVSASACGQISSDIAQSSLNAAPLSSFSHSFWAKVKVCKWAVSATEICGGETIPTSSISPHAPW